MMVFFYLGYPTVNGSRIPIGFTRSTQFQAYLPRGDPDANYNLVIVVEIRDELGAIQSYPLPESVTVRIYLDLTSFQMENRINLYCFIIGST